MGEETLRSAMAYQTIKYIPTDETLFLLAYATEAIISVDIYKQILRTEEIDYDKMSIDFA